MVVKLSFNPSKGTCGPEQRSFLSLLHSTYFLRCFVQHCSSQVERVDFSGVLGNGRLCCCYFEDRIPHSERKATLLAEWLEIYPDLPSSNPHSKMKRTYRTQRTLDTRRVRGDTMRHFPRRVLLLSAETCDRHPFLDRVVLRFSAPVWLPEVWLMPFSRTWDARSTGHDLGRTTLASFALISDPPTSGHRLLVGANVPQCNEKETG